MKLKIVFIFILIFASSLLKPSHLFGEDISIETDLNTKIAEYTQKLSDLGKAKNTLANQISILNSQIQLTSLKISQTQNNIKTLISDISDLSTKIGGLDNSLNQLTSVYIQQTSENYKMAKRYPQLAIFVTNNFNSFLEQFKYISTVQKSSQNTLISLETVRTNYNIQKTAKTQKQQELQTLQNQLAVQQTNLDKQKVSKTNLLNVTKNDETKYQQLLADAIRQLNALRNFSSSNGATCLSAPAGGGVGGWFYSQRDPRWCNQYIGYSKDTIGAVGCFISSLTMIWKKYGNSMDPSVYASNPGYFLGSTAWMTNPVAPPGYSYRQVSGYNRDVLDKELSADRPVIVQLQMKGTSAGMHFVVLKSGSNGHYIMNDPWYGADLNFTDHYSTGLIMSLRLITK